MRMSFMQVRNPHMKNSVVTMLSARLSVLPGPSSKPAESKPVEDGRCMIATRILWEKLRQHRTIAAPENLRALR
jgi:hypothetical protein